MKISPKLKKVFKWFLIVDLYIEGIFFAYYGIMYTKHNFRWNGKLIFEPQWVQDDDYLDRSGFTTMMLADLKRMQDEYEREQLAKEVHEDDMKIPRKKRE